VAKKGATIGRCPSNLAINKPPTTKAKYSFPLASHLVSLMATAKVLKVEILFIKRVDNGRITTGKDLES